MSQHPTTFQGESGGEAGFGWEDSASLLRKESAGVAHNFQIVSKARLAS
jgi:hypothetical protein